MTLKERKKDSDNDNISDEDLNNNENNMEIENIDVGESYKEMINLLDYFLLEVNDNKKSDNDKIKSDETIVKKNLKTNY